MKRKMWAAVNRRVPGRDSYLGTVRQYRGDVIKELTKGFKRTWPELKKYGLRIVRVDVREL